MLLLVWLPTTRYECLLPAIRTFGQVPNTVVGKGMRILIVGNWILG